MFVEKELEKLQVLRPDASLRKEASPHNEGIRSSGANHKIPGSPGGGPDFVSLTHWAPGLEQHRKRGLGTNHKHGGGFQSVPRFCSPYVGVCEAHHCDRQNQDLATKRNKVRLFSKLYFP